MTVKKEKDIYQVTGRAKSSYVLIDGPRCANPTWGLGLQKGSMKPYTWS